MFRISPVINESEKSILAFHKVVRKARRSCLALYFCSISYGKVFTPRGELTCEHATHVNRDEILERLAHFQALYVQMTSVYEIIYPCGAIMVGLDAVEPNLSTRIVSEPHLYPPLTEPFHYRGEETLNRYPQSEYPCCCRKSRRP